MMSDNYENECLTALCEVLEDWEVTEEQAKNLAADLVAEWKGREEQRNEAAYDRYQERLMENGVLDDSTYRRNMREAGRGHLLK